MIATIATGAGSDPHHMAQHADGRLEAGTQRIYACHGTACQDRCVDTLPTTDPVALLRARDGIYADDLLIEAVAHLDLFTALAEEPCDVAHMARLLGLALRPADVMSTLFRATGLLEPGPTLRPIPLAAEHLVRGAPFDLRPYLASLAQRPACLDLLEVARADRPAPWASTAGGRAWTEAMSDEGFADTIAAAMDARLPMASHHGETR